MLLFSDVHPQGEGRATEGIKATVEQRPELLGQSLPACKIERQIRMLLRNKRAPANASMSSMFLNPKNLNPKS